VVCVAPDLVQGEVMLKNLGAVPPAGRGNQAGVAALKKKLGLIAIEHLEARSLGSLKSIQSINLRIFDDH
jgi:hypothetical protein